MNPRAPRSGDPDLLYRYRDGVFRSDLFTAAAVELDVFNWIEENSRDFAGLCAGLGLAARPADVLATLLRAMGLVETDADGLVRLTPLAREHLTHFTPLKSEKSL